MIGVIYARVSTDEQAEKGLSIPAQVETCRAYAKENAIAIAREFLDEGESAKTADRPGFQEMIAYARANREVKAVIVYDTSRFARNRYDAALYKRNLEKHEVRVHYATQHIEDTPEGKFLEGILELFDEHYSRSLARVVRRGMKESVKRGNWLGSPPWGYELVRDKDGKRTLHPCPKNAQGVRIVFDLFGKGFGCRTIAEKLTALGYRTITGKAFLTEQVRQLIRNPAYTGDTFFNRRSAGKRQWHPKEEWIHVENTHEALVSKEVFKAVQAEMDRRGQERHPGEFKTYRCFAGLVQCGKCGATANAETGTGKMGVRYYYYTCRTRCKRAKRLCEGFRLRSDFLERSLIEAVQGRIFCDQNLQAFLGYVQEKVDQTDHGRTSEKIRFQRRLEAVQAKLRKVVLAFEDELIDPTEAKRRTQELHRERDELQERLAKLNDVQALRDMIPTKVVLEAARKDLLKVLADSDARTQRNFFQRFIRRIKVNGETADIVYNLAYLGAGNGVLNSIRVGGPWGTRTPNPRIMSPLLCSFELRARAPDLWRDGTPEPAAGQSRRLSCALPQVEHQGFDGRRGAHEGDRLDPRYRSPVARPQRRAVEFDPATDDLDPDVSAGPHLRLRRFARSEPCGVNARVLLDPHRSARPIRRSDQRQPAPVRDRPLFIPGLQSATPGKNPDLQQPHRLVARRVPLAVLDPAPRRHALDLARADDRPVPQAVAVLQPPLHDIRQNLHVAMKVGRKPRGGGHPVLVDHPQRPEPHVVGVDIVPERKGVSAVEPVGPGAAPVLRAADLNSRRRHSGPILPTVSST
jgi:site-specific DNA recombinase